MSAITPTNPQAKKSSSSDPISRRANLGQKLVPPEAEVNISVLEHKDEFYSPAFLFESSSSDPISRRANLVPPEAVIRLLPAKGCEEVDDVYFPGYFSEEDASCVPPVLNPADKVNPSDEVDEVDNAVIRLSSSSDPISRRANLVPPEAVIGLLPAKGCDIEEDASCIPPVLNPADKVNPSHEVVKVDNAMLRSIWSLVKPEVDKVDFAIIKSLPAKGCDNEEVDKVYFSGFFSEEDASFIPPDFNPAHEANPSNQ